MLTVKTKKWVRSIGLFATPVLVLVALVSAAQADVRDGSLNFRNVPNTQSGRGGEYNIQPTSGPALDFVSGTPGLSAYPGSFQSFSLEENEDVGISSGPYVYDYDINTGAVDGGVGGQLPNTDFDPLSPITAWLYTSFINGSLGDVGTFGTYAYDYTVGSGREASAGALQRAIWYSENEISTQLTGAAAAYYDAAEAAGWETIRNVRVLNLYYGTGQDSFRQDQLVLINSVPVPSAILLGLPLLGMIGAYRRVRRR
jgi:hypothetical protein